MQHRKLKTEQGGPNQIGGDLRTSWRVSRSCSTCGSRFISQQPCFIIIAYIFFNFFIWIQDGNVYVYTLGTYQLSSVKQLFHNGQPTGDGVRVKPIFSPRVSINIEYIFQYYCLLFFSWCSYWTWKTPRDALTHCLVSMTSRILGVCFLILVGQVLKEDITEVTFDKPNNYTISKNELPIQIHFEERESSDITLGRWPCTMYLFVHFRWKWKKASR